jgi:hypothetical protein
MKILAIQDGQTTHVCGSVSSDELVALLEAIGGPMAKRRTKRKVSKTKRAAKARAHGRPVYKVKAGWAVGKKARKARRRRR